MYKYNHSKQIKKIKDEGFSQRYLGKELKLLALHYKEGGVSPKKRREFLYRFCEENIQGFNKVKYFKAINSAVNYSSNKKNRVIDIDKIELTQSELNLIDKLNVEYTHKKVLFTWMVLDRLSKEVYRQHHGEEPEDSHRFSSKPYKYQELEKSSTITKAQMKKQGYKNLQEMIHCFVEEGIVQSNIGYVDLLYLYNKSAKYDGSDGVAIIVKDYEHIGYYYDLYNGTKNIRRCEDCEQLIKIKSNRTKRCEECRRKQELIRQREKWHRYKSSL